MKAITVNSLDIEIGAANSSLTSKNVTLREVILMNLVSNILIKDHDVKQSAIENRKSSKHPDHGFNLYKALEFSRDSAKKASSDLQMERICSRLF